MGTDEMCLLKNGLNQQFPTGDDGALPTPTPSSGEIRSCLPGTFLSQLGESATGI